MIAYKNMPRTLTSAQRYNRHMDILFEQCIKSRNKWDNIRKLEVEYQLADDESEKIAIKLSLETLKEGETK